ncbi:hypothetical protein V5O48_000701 [Marasmius crinis-equi]|uniref:F-box domain-containing protein n=1 Tax=Marasmius crinis-equi TaxID=585013 RepID=A0ABR3G0L3_9AGAR
MLQLSKSAHLSIDAHVSCIPNCRLDALSEALKHISRTRTLFIEARKSEIEGALSTVTEPAPFLRSMELVCHPPADFITLPDSFLGCDTPRLHKLELYRCQIPWNTPFLTDLTFLKIDWSGYRCRRPLTIAQFVEIFRSMSELTALELRNCLPLCPYTTNSPESVVFFPRLRQLVLASTEAQCANVLNHVSFPSTTAITLVCESAGRDVKPFSSLAGLFSSSALVGEWSVRFADFIFQTQCISLKMWNTANDGETNSPGLPCLDLQLDWRGPYELVIRIIRVSSSKHDLSAQAIINYFGSLSQLNKITVANCAIDFFEAIGRNVGSNDPSPSDHRCTSSFPALRTLEFDEISLYSSQPESRRYINGLLTALEWRPRNGVSVQKLLFRKCWYLFREDIKLIEELVGDVDWDGYERDYGEKRKRARKL